MSEAKNLLAEWAWLLFDSLAAAGVREVVLSPGSRSTPFVLAAAAHPSLRIHDVIDERSAAFFALGMARATGRPPLLLCTSGTAGAHYLPAVIEAREAHLPLLVLTADRPFELQGCAAPQTIDQTKLYGDHARAFFELGMPDSQAGALRSLGRMAAQAVAASLGPLPGAVHLNARARKPLEPPRAKDEDGDEGDEERALRARVRAVAEQPPTRAFAPRLLPDEEGLALLERAVRAARRGLIVCGPAPASQAQAREAIFALARRTGFPLLVEATSQLRFVDAPEGVVRIDAFDALVGARHGSDAEAPDFVLQLGAPPTSGAWERYLAAHASPSLDRWVVAPHGWPDPQSDARGLLVAEPGLAAAALAERLAAGPTEPSAWSARWAADNAVAWREIHAALDEGGPLSEPAVARVAARSVPAGGLLVVGNSLPIRDVESYATASSARCVVLSQRGANGIDGLLSGAAGAAAATGIATTLLVGDVSALHDLGGLAVCARATSPLVIVIVNNAGGRIFEQLPVAGVAAAALLEHWTTPHALDFEAAARQFRIAYHHAEDADALGRALADAQARSGCTVVEARVPASSAREMAARVRARVGAALGRGGAR